MRRSIYIIHGAILSLMIVAIVWGFQTASTLAQGSPACAGNYVIDERLTSDTRWQLCWEHRANEGIVLRDIFYTTASGIRRKVLREAGLAQIHTAFDDNSQHGYHLTDLGLGGDRLMALTAEDCPEGQLLAHEGSNLLCMEIIERGYLYKHAEQQRQGNYLSLYSISDVGGQSFIVRWRFYDDGTIEPGIGSTGYLTQFGNDPRFGWPVENGDAENGDIAIGYTNSYYWRLDFDIGGNGDEEDGGDIVEEFNVTSAELGSKKEISVTQLTQEAGRTVEPQFKRSWRVRDGSITNSDGHFISYHLEALNVGHRYSGPTTEPWSHNDIYFTRYKSCERFASHNVLNEQASNSGCGENLAEFVDGESIDSADIVLWYGLSYHHLPRNEDQPFIPIHWDSFTLLPRDWTATSELAN